MSKDRNKKYYLSEKQLDKVKRQITKEATAKAMLLCVAAMAEHLHLTDEQICSTAVNIDRWADFMDQKILRINEVSDIIKNKTGLEFGKF